MLEVKTTDEPVQNEVGPFAVTTGAGFPVTFIVLLVFVHAPIVLTTEYAPVLNAAVLFTTNVVAFAPAMATPFFIHCRDTVPDAATLDVKVTVAVPQIVVLPVAVITGFAGCVPVNTHEHVAVLNVAVCQHAVVG